MRTTTIVVPSKYTITHNSTMKHVKFLFGLAIALSLVACNKAENKVETGEAQEAATASSASTAINVDAANSVIHWTGSKLTGKHTGTLKLSDGVLSVKDGNIVAGKFVIDMSSLTVTDLTGDGKSDLEGHLMNADFFNVEAFPKATFEIVDSRKVENSESGITHQITGNLTMLDKTKSVTIPATVSTDGGFSAKTPEFSIDRTEWGIQYGSGKFGALKDKAISDDMQLRIELTGA